MKGTDDEVDYINCTYKYGLMNPAIRYNYGASIKTLKRTYLNIQ